MPTTTTGSFAPLHSSSSTSTATATTSATLTAAEDVSAGKGDEREEHGGAEDPVRPHPARGRRVVDCDGKGARGLLDGLGVAQPQGVVLDAWKVRKVRRRPRGGAAARALRPVLVLDDRRRLVCGDEQRVLVRKVREPDLVVREPLVEHPRVHARDGVRFAHDEAAVAVHVRAVGQLALRRSPVLVEVAAVPREEQQAPRFEADEERLAKLAERGDEPARVARAQRVVRVDKDDERRRAVQRRVRAGGVAVRRHAPAPPPPRAPKLEHRVRQPVVRDAREQVVQPEAVLGRDHVDVHAARLDGRRQGQGRSTSTSCSCSCS